MKRLNAIFAALVMLFIASCSSEKSNDLLSQIPADANVVIVGNPQTIMESAGGSLSNSAIKLPDYILAEIPLYEQRALANVNEMLEASGISTDVGAIFAQANSGNPVFVLKIADKGKFVNLLEEGGFDKESSKHGADIYNNYSNWVAINGSCALVTSGYNAEEDLEKALAGAARKSIGETPFSSRLTEGNAFSALVQFPEEVKREMLRNGAPAAAAKIYDGAVSMNGNLTGGKCVIDCKFFDKEGNNMDFSAMKQFFNIGATINEDALALLGRDEFAVLAVSMKDVNWDSLAETVFSQLKLSRSDRTAANIALGYLKNIDGTVAAGFGLTNGLESIAEVNRDERTLLSNISATMVVETKNGKAAQMFDEMKGLMDQFGIPYNNAGQEISIELRNVDRYLSGTLYAKCEGNLLAVSTHPIRRDHNPVAGSVDCGRQLSTLGVVLNSENKLMRDFGIDNDLTAALTVSPDYKDVKLTFEIAGGPKEGFIAKLVKLAMEINKNSDAIEYYLRSSYGYEESYGECCRDYDDYYDDYDYEW